MDELDDGGERNMLVAGIAQGARRKGDQQRPQAFTAAVDDVRPELVNEGDVGIEPPVDLAIHRFPVGLGQCQDGSEIHGLL